MGDDSGSGNYYFCQAQVKARLCTAPFNNPRWQTPNNLESKFSRVGDNYRSIDEVASALPHAEVKSFGRKSLHYIGTINPYQQAISIIGKTSSVFNQDNLIPCYGFRYGGSPSINTSHVEAAINENGIGLLSLRKVDSWSSLINGSRLSGHMVIVFAEEAAQELMCKNMNLTLMPLITSFLKMSASGYNKAPR
ncbi:unnamed protein product [Brassica rapa subsp. trilocularis]